MVWTTMSAATPAPAAPAKGLADNPSAKGALEYDEDDPKRASSTSRGPRRRALALLARLLLLALPLGGGTWMVYEDALAATPWYNVKQLGFTLQGEGPNAFRASFSGDTTGSVNPRFSYLSARSITCDTRLEVSRSDGTLKEVVPFANIKARSPTGDDDLIRFGGVEPDVVQDLDVRPLRNPLLCLWSLGRC